jgi:hypothetical protein
VTWDSSHCVYVEETFSDVGLFHVCLCHSGRIDDRKLPNHRTNGFVRKRIQRCPLAGEADAAPFPFFLERMFYCKSNWFRLK